MKLTTLVLIISLMHICTAGRGQITLKEKNASLDKVLADIEKQTKYYFLYDPDNLKMKPITIEVKNATIQETLAKCFKGESIEFTIVGNNVLLKRKQATNDANPAAIRIRGKVVDDTGLALTGVTVFNKMGFIGTETDTSGRFTIPAKKGDVLSFSYVGYQGKEIPIADQANISVSLEVNASGPDQVVVIGYGNSKKRDLTGSVSAVEMKNVDEIPFNTVDNALAGRAAGVQVIKTDGTPGGMVRMRIRGTSSLLGGNDPLYVIDGVPVQLRNNFIDPGFLVSSPAGNLAGVLGGAANGATLSASFVNGLNSLGGLNPEDIESITVLKDASSTAIYGSKAANGVVIITTRTGSANTLPRVAIDHYATVGSLYKKQRLLNTPEYKTLLTEAARNAFDENTARGFPVGPLTETILDSPSTYFGAANTDWVKEVTRTTYSNNIHLSVTGGGQTSKYFSSFTYSNTPGVVDGTDFRRITGKINLETAISPKFRTFTNLLVGFTDQDIGTGAYVQALLARPDLTPHDAAGNYTDFDFQANGDGTFGFLNPAALLTATNNARTVSLLGSVGGIYAISRDLQFRSAVSLNMQSYNQRNFIPSYIEIDGTYGNEDNPGGTGSNANSRFADWFLENTLTYNRKIGKHSINTVVGQSYETTKYSWFRATATGYPNNTTLTGLSSASTVLSVAGDDPKGPQSYLLSFYARTNYSYLDKYMATFTGRADGSSKFGPNNKYGYFPSGAVAWRISREKFLKDVSWINDMKLRGSYGLTGNQNIGDQMYRTLYSPVTYGGGSALIPTQLGNQGIKWEGTKEADAGMDLSLLSDRLTASFDYYNKQTSGALLSLPVAANSSYGSLLENAVGLRNRGFEVNIGGDIIRGRDLRWSASINIAWNNSLVTRLDSRADLQQIPGPSGLESISNQVYIDVGNTGLFQGKPLGLFTGSFITGVIKTKAQLDAYSRQLGPNADFYSLRIGAPMYLLDSNKSSFLYQSPLKNTVIGSGAPKYFGGMTQELSYKGFGLQCYFTFSHGGHLLWAKNVTNRMFYATANAGRSLFNRYTPANTNSDQPGLSLNDLLATETNLDIFSSSYLKLRSLTLNYHFNQAGWMKRAAINNLQVFMSATNVFTITKYPGSDPETSDDAYSVQGGYIDADNYPAIRTISLGLKAVF